MLRIFQNMNTTQAPMNATGGLDTSVDWVNGTFSVGGNASGGNDSFGAGDGSPEDPALELSLAVPMGIGMYLLSLLTVVGNAMVLHAIRTERRLQTVSALFFTDICKQHSCLTLEL